MKTNDEIDDMIKPYIYESPDNGDTVYRREMGSSDKELISGNNTMTMVNPSDYSDLLDDTLDIIDISNIGNITLSDTSQIVDSSQSDITLKVNGKDRKVSELFNAIDAIEKRLGILRPDPKLLDKYELLQSLYEQYKAAEAILDGPDPEDEK
jgi:hypothetical protein